MTEPDTKTETKTEEPQPDSRPDPRPPADRWVAAIPSAAEMTDVMQRFRHHTPTSDEVGENHQVWRAGCMVLAGMAMCLPNSRERSLALTHLEEAMFWGNAVIARYQVGGSLEDVMDEVEMPDEAWAEGH